MKIEISDALLARIQKRFDDEQQWTTEEWSEYIEEVLTNLIESWEEA